MKIVHVIAGLPHAGGMSELVPLLALEQHRLGHDVAVVTVGNVSAATALGAERAGVRVVGCRLCRPRFLYCSLEMFFELKALIRDVDLVHIHGCWTFPVWWGCHLALKLRKPFVRSPHGCLSPERLKISRWKKVLAGLFFERRYFESATVIHATAESEAQEIRTYLGGSRLDAGEFSRQNDKAQGSSLSPHPSSLSPQIIVIPNGVDAEAFGGTSDREWFDQHWPECKGKRVVLFLSRLHPIKGLDLLVEAWGKVRSSKVLKCESSKVPECEDQNFRTSERQNFSTSPWHLLIAGPDEQGTLGRLRSQVDRLGMGNSVTFCGPLYGKEKVTAIASANLFVLPTLNENFGIVVAEALACGVPVITTKGAPWSELLGNSDSSKVLKCESSKVREFRDLKLETQDPQTHALMNSRSNELPPDSSFILHPSSFATSGRCGWWVEIGVEPLVEALREAMSLTDEERHAMGENGRRLVEAKYQWPMIAKAMMAVYEDAVKGHRDGFPK